MKKAPVTLFILIFLSPVYVLACTSFYLEHATAPVHGANFDWQDGEGFIVINKRGVIKQAISNPKKRLNPLNWKSKYGSVTFNLYGCDLPWGGMNEAGLSCSTMLLDETKYPIPDSRPSIFMWQWLQYLLDTCANIEDVIASESKLRIRETSNGLGAHYFFCDRQGNCAIIEFIEGERVAYFKESMPIKALTNDRYELCLSIANNYHGLGGESAIPNGHLSYMRFVRVASMLESSDWLQESSTLDRAFAILDNASYKFHRTTHTQWRIVFDIHNHRIWYLTRNQNTIKQIDMKSVDFSCASSIMMRNIDSAIGAGGINGFVKYDYKTNRTMAKKLIKLNPLRPKHTGERLERVVHYPETFICQE